MSKEGRRSVSAAKRAWQAGVLELCNPDTGEAGFFQDGIFVTLMKIEFPFYGSNKDAFEFFKLVATKLSLNNGTSEGLFKVLVEQIKAEPSPHNAVYERIIAFKNQMPEGIWKYSERDLNNKELRDLQKGKKS